MPCDHDDIELVAAVVEHGPYGVAQQEFISRSPSISRIWQERVGQTGPWVNAHRG